ncbi:zinc finger and BTB domain-containing protein 17-like isoform X2 [Spodoptera litura]|uniref:Zinc finger and BTB domain-containing protein 17-like isoform X2 n=1 Tax=Spodoptera litura TaxID=69820 RepID=A0A9J7IVF9_SPOLT|nr:zinc finger and BTB domain-containing protein 17-like isoform X2 [Spodoptera litura]
MNQCCFICNAKASVALKNAITLFGNDSTLPSGKKITDILSEIVEKPVQNKKVHTDVLCKKCWKTCCDYDTTRIRLETMKSELLEQFKSSITAYKLDYENYEKNEYGTPQKPKSAIGKTLVLPASKLQPIPPDLLLKVGKLAAFSKPNIVLPQIKPTTASTLNLKVTVGSSVLTQTIKTTTAKTIETQQIDTNSILNSLSNALKDDIDSLTSGDEKAIMSFDVNSLPKDFLSGTALRRMNEKDSGKTDKISDDHTMEIDEVVPVSSAGSGLLLQVESLQPPPRPEGTHYLDIEPLEGGNPDPHKFIFGKLQMLNEQEEEDDDDDEDEEGHTIVVDSENGSILRMVTGQKFIYEGGEISLVVPDDDQADAGDTHDHADSQDSNDESQIELQVSGDEETANAIIAAAQEKGGAFIKVESGEMFRVKSVSSSARPTTPLQIVAPHDDKFKCLLCEKNGSEKEMISEADAMMRHLKTVHDARLYLCRFCGVVMRKRTEYASHIAEHVSEGKSPAGGGRGAHRCTTCGKWFASRGLLRDHLNVHVGARPHVCTVCHKAFASKYTHQAHLKTHAVSINNVLVGARPHVCTVCHKAFASKYTHQAHLKTHAVRPRPFKCSQCGKSFLTQQNLNQHEKTHSGIKDFVCNICNKAFSTQHNLEVHGVVHSGNKAFVCTHCGKAFARRAELRDHTRIHTGERPFSCELCGARFTQRSNLHSHRRATHYDDKRYQCELCPKKFKRRRLLEYHTKASHTGERPLKCGVCQLSFVYPEHYKKHVRIHSGERPYVCEICGKSFNSRDNRNTHRFVHSDKKPYECVACGAGYMRKQLLYAHMNTSGHLAESIVVNQPRVIKVTENGTSSHATDITDHDTKTNKFDAIFESQAELEASIKSVKSEAEVNLGDAKFYITEDKKLILQDSGGDKTLNLIQEGDESTLLTIHNLGERADATILEAVNADQLADQTEIVANDENGGVVRLIQIKLPDGNNGWVAINR